MFRNTMIIANILLSLAVGTPASAQDAPQTACQSETVTGLQLVAPEDYEWRNAANPQRANPIFVEQPGFIGLVAQGILSQTVSHYRAVAGTTVWVKMYEYDSTVHALQAAAAGQRAELMGDGYPYGDLNVPCGQYLIALHSQGNPMCPRTEGGPEPDPFAEREVALAILATAHVSSA